VAVHILLLHSSTTRTEPALQGPMAAITLLSTKTRL